jgi:hypothetical protein
MSGRQKQPCHSGRQPAWTVKPTMGQPLADVRARRQARPRTSAVLRSTGGTPTFRTRTGGARTPNPSTPPANDLGQRRVLGPRQPMAGASGVSAVMRPGRIHKLMSSATAGIGPDCCCLGAFLNYPLAVHSLDRLRAVEITTSGDPDHRSYSKQREVKHWATARDQSAVRKGKPREMCASWCTASGSRRRSRNS